VPNKLNFRPDFHSYIITTIIFCFVLSSILASHADEFPNWIRDKADEIKVKGNVNIHSLILILQDLESEGLIKDAKFQYPSYQIPNRGQTEFVKISGSVNDYGKSGPVAITIIAPNKSFIKLHTPVLETGNYSTILPINEQFQKGMYTVLAEFAGKKLPSTYFFLIEDKIESKIPQWFIKNFSWWINKEITDQDFVLSVQYLLDNNIMRIDTKKDLDTAEKFDVIVSGQQAVRRGTTHTITTHVFDGKEGIEGARVSLVIEDYGEDTIREFEGFTNQNGDFIFSWEIPKSFDDIETLLAFVSVTHGDFSRTVLFKFQVYCIAGESGCKVEGN